MPEYIDKWQAVANLMDAHLKDTQKAVDAIQYMPTVDAVTVQHGEWLQEHGIYCCSKCGAVAPYDVQGDIIEYWPDLRFCYRCGAKMDKGIVVPNKKEEDDG